MYWISFNLVATSTWLAKNWTLEAWVLHVDLLFDYMNLEKEILLLIRFFKRKDLNRKMTMNGKQITKKEKKNETCQLLFEWTSTTNHNMIEQFKVTRTNA